MNIRHFTQAISLIGTGTMALSGCGLDVPESEDVSRNANAAVMGASFTTFDEVQGGCLHGNGNGINCNHYHSKPDVYVNGGPVHAGLSDGVYYFTVLTPGSQNGGFLQGAEGNLSDDVAHGDGDDGSGDSIADRTFEVEDHQIVANLGTHKEGESPNGKLILQLFPFDDTNNPGGVYILSVCKVGATKPNDCKYDMFKVDLQPPPEPICGDGTMDEGEECDDGNTTGGDGCSSTCTVEPPPPPPCCGDGTVDAGEECDDGNTTSGDGCSSTCTVEPPPPPPPPSCGDGTVDEGEECDDGNTTSLDGCSSTCLVDCPPT